MHGEKRTGKPTQKTDMDHQRAAQLVRSLKAEDDLRKKLLVPLLQKMGFVDVIHHHGPLEQGKDIVATRQNPGFTDEHYAFVVKKDGINATAGKRHSIQNVWDQVLAAFNTPFVHGGRKLRINKVVVVSGGQISHQAEKQLQEYAETNQLLGANLEFAGVERVAAWVTEHWPEAYEDIHCNIYSALCKACLEDDVLGGMEVGQERGGKQLCDVFIELSVRHYKKRRGRSGTFSMKDVYQNYKASEVLKKLPGNLLFVGEAGSGKSTVLKTLYARLCNDVRVAENAPIPVFMKAVWLDSLEDKADVTTLIDSALRRWPLDQSERNAISAAAKKNNCVLFVDGIDEIKDTEVRSKVINLLAAPMRGARVISSSRGSAFPGGWAPDGVTRLQMLPLNPDSVGTFISRWFADDDKVASKLSEMLRDGTVNNVLPMTPMALTLLAITINSSHYRQEIPTNITELYSMFADVCLDKWDAQKGIGSTFEYQIKHEALISLASAWQDAGHSCALEGDVCGFLENHFAQSGLPLDIELLVQELIDRSGLLKVNDSGYVEFSHFSFQSFFAAESLRDRADFAGFAAASFSDPWWQLSVFFAVGLRKHADDVFAQAPKDWSQLSGPTQIELGRNIGLTLQAGFMTSQQTKVEWCALGLELMANALERGVGGDWHFESAKDLPAAYYYVIFFEIAKEAYGSLVLNEAIQDVATSPGQLESDFMKWVLMGPLSRLDLWAAQGIEQTLSKGSHPHYLFLSSYLLGRVEERTAVTRRIARKLGKRSRRLHDATKTLFLPPKLPRKGSAEEVND